MSKNIVQIGKAKLIVCNDCKKFGSNVVQTTSKQPTPKVAYVPKKIVKKAHEVNLPEYTIREDYAEIIKKGRENMGMTQDMLASTVGERLSVIKKIESGKMKPTIELAKKIEKLLKVSLLEIDSSKFEIEKLSKKSDLTVADILDIKED